MTKTTKRRHYSYTQRQRHQHQQQPYRGPGAGYYGGRRRTRVTTIEEAVVVPVPAYSATSLLGLPMVLRICIWNFVGDTHHQHALRDLVLLSKQIHTECTTTGSSSELLWQILPTIQFRRRHRRRREDEKEEITEEYDDGDADDDISVVGGSTTTVFEKLFHWDDEEDDDNTKDGRTITIDSKKCVKRRKRRKKRKKNTKRPLHYYQRIEVQDITTFDDADVPALGLAWTHHQYAQKRAHRFQLPSIRSLDLSSPVVIKALNDELPVYLFKIVPNLRDIDLSNTSFMGFTLLERLLEYCPKLERLRWDNIRYIPASGAPLQTPLQREVPPPQFLQQPLVPRNQNNPDQDRMIELVANIRVLQQQPLEPLPPAPPREVVVVPRNQNNNPDQDRMLEPVANILQEDDVGILQLQEEDVPRRNHFHAGMRGERGAGARRMRGAGANMFQLQDAVVPRHHQLDMLGANVANNVFRINALVTPPSTHRPSTIQEILMDDAHCEETSSLKHTVLSDLTNHDPDTVLFHTWLSGCHPQLTRLSLRNLQIGYHHNEMVPISQNALIKLARNLPGSVRWFRSNLTSDNMARLQLERPEIVFCG